MKKLSEMGISLMFYGCLRMLGWNSNDKDKYQKLADNSWAKNHLIYQIMAIKSDEEQFIPFEGMGLDEWMRLFNNPTIALTHLGQWNRLLRDMASPTETLPSKSGFWEKGDTKLLIQPAKIAGFTGELSTLPYSLKTSTIKKYLSVFIQRAKDQVEI